MTNKQKFERFSRLGETHLKHIFKKGSRKIFFSFFFFHLSGFCHFLSTGQLLERQKNSCHFFFQGTFDAVKRKTS